MNVKKFDKESATLGNAVIVMQPPHHTATPGRYLAQMEDGRHVVEFVAVSGTHFVNVVDEQYIFVVPVKRTVYFNLHRLGQKGDEIPAYMHETEDEARNKAKGFEMHYFAIAVPIEIEV